MLVRNRRSAGWAGDHVVLSHRICLVAEAELVRAIRE
jgi:hypothetical protein